MSLGVNFLFSLRLDRLPARLYCFDGRRQYGYRWNDSVIFDKLAQIFFLFSEHLSLCLALNVPVFVVITKIDRCPAPVLEETLKQLNKLLRSPGSRKSPIAINSVEDLYLAAQNFYGGKWFLIVCFSLLVQVLESAQSLKFQMWPERIWTMFAPSWIFYHYEDHPATKKKFTLLLTKFSG